MLNQEAACLPIDWLYTYILKREDIATYWSTVSIFLRGQNTSIRVIAKIEMRHKSYVNLG